MTPGQRHWRLYDKVSSSYRVIEAANCRVEDGAYVFLDAEGRELARFPQAEHGGLASVGWLKDTCA